MPNGYFIVPNIIPGNVSIGGNLTIGGDTLRLGSGAPFVRLQRVTASLAALGFNVEAVTDVRDSLVVGAAKLGMNVNPFWGVELFNAAGNVQPVGIEPPDQGVNFVTATHTGDVLETTLRSTLIRANLLGTTAGVFVLVSAVANVQGGVATTLRLKYGGAVVATRSVAAVVGQLWLAWLRNQAAANAQRTHAIVLEGAAVAVNSLTDTAVDSTVNQNVEFTVQLGAAADSWSVRAYLLQLVSRL